MPSERPTRFYNMLNIPLILKLQYQVQIVGSNLFSQYYDDIDIPL